MTRNEQLQEAARLAKKIDALAKAEATAFAEAAERVKRRFAEKRAALLMAASSEVVELCGVDFALERDRLIDATKDKSKP